MDHTHVFSEQPSGRLVVVDAARSEAPLGCRTGDGERAVGSYPAGTPDEALAFFTERFDALAFEVQLLEQRVNAAKLTPAFRR